MRQRSKKTKPRPRPLRQDDRDAGSQTPDMLGGVIEKSEPACGRNYQVSPAATERPKDMKPQLIRADGLASTAGSTGE